MWSGATSALQNALMAKNIETTIRIDVGANSSIPAAAIESLSYTHTFSNDNTLDIGGGVASAQIQVSLIDDGNLPNVLRNVALKPFIGVKVDGSYVWIPLGYFYMDDSTYTKNMLSISFTAYDRFFFADDVAISHKNLKNLFPDDTKKLRINKTLLDYICQRIGITNTITNSQLRCRTFIQECGSSATYPAEILWYDAEDDERAISARQLLSYIAQMEGGSFRIDRENNLIIDRIYTQYPGVSWYIFNPNRYISFNRTNFGEPTVVSAIRGKATRKSGNVRQSTRKVENVNGVMLEFQNPLLYAADMFGGVGSRCTPIMSFLKQLFLPITYYSYSLETLGFPILDVGDMITVVDEDGNSLNVYVLCQELNYSNGGMTSTFSAEPITQNKSVGVSSSAATSLSGAGLMLEGVATDVDTLNANAITTDTLYAKSIEAGLVDTTTLEADVADLESLIATKASVSDLNAANANITALQTGKADVADLNAATADIEDLKTDKADVSALTAIEADIDNLEANKASVSSLNAAVADISSLQTNKADVADLNAAIADIEDLQADKADITDLNAATANLSSLIATKASITDLNAANANITSLQASKANVSDLNAAVADIENLKTDKADIDLANINNGCITTAMLGTGVVDTAQIADGSITDAKIVGMTANKITAGTIDAANIDVVNLDCANLTVGTINGTQIGTGAVDTSNIASGAITTPKIDTGAITTNLLAANAITTDKVVANAITGAKIAANTITANNIAANTITSTQIASNTITANEIASGTITGNQIAASTITADKIDINNLFARDITTTHSFQIDTPTLQFKTNAAGCWYGVDVSSQGTRYISRVSCDLVNGLQLYSNQSITLTGGVNNVIYVNSPISLTKAVSIGGNLGVSGSISSDDGITADYLSADTDIYEGNTKLSDKYAAKSHTHSQYAGINHTHSQYEPTLSVSEFSITAASGETYAGNTHCHAYGKMRVISYQGASKAHSNGATIFTIPSGHRPSYDIYVPFTKNGKAYGQLKITSGGTCTVNLISSTTEIGRIYAQITYFV